MTERCRRTVYFRVTGRVLKIQIIQGWKRGASALAAEICAGPHNRLLRRQHCSSLCLQGEGYEHVANIASALGHIFVGFLAVFVATIFAPPHFASKVSYSASSLAFAECSRSASCRCTASAMLLGQKPCRVFSWILNSLPFRALLFVLCSFIMCALLRHLLLGQKSCRIFQEFEHPGPRLADFPRSL